MRTNPLEHSLQAAGQLFQRYRKQARISQEELGSRSGFSPTYISLIERGERRPPSDTLAIFAAQLPLRPLERVALWTYFGYEPPTEAAPTSDTAIPHSAGVPAVAAVYGRERELETLEKWIDRDGTPIVGLRGLGGIGKTALAAALCARLGAQFTHVRWLTLNPATPAADTLRACLRSLVGEGPADGGQHVDAHVDAHADDPTAALASALAAHLREHRCLLVLDQVESVLAPGTPAGTFQAGYAGYGALVEAIGDTASGATTADASRGSCLLLVGRELPWVRRWADDTTGLPHYVSLAGVGVDGAERILAAGGLTGTEARRRALIARYAGHPLALKLVAGTVRALFGGNLDQFQTGGQDPGRGLGVPAAVRDLLDREFARLSPRERDLVYWLAVAREPVTLQALWADRIPREELIDIADALTALHERSLVEFHGQAASALHPLPLDHFTGRLVAAVGREIEIGEYALFASHALLTAQAPDAVRETQRQALVAPLLERLRASLGARELERRLRAVLADLRSGALPAGAYTAGNTLNLLVTLGSSLRGLDASGLVIRQAYLRAVDLAGASFADADLATCVFDDTRGAALSLAWSARTQRLAAGTMRGAVLIWDTLSGAPPRRLRGHRGWVGAVAFSPDGRWLASGGDDHDVRLWDISSERTDDVRHLLRGHGESVRGVAFSPDGRLLASASDDHTIRLWDVATGAYVRTLAGHTDRVRGVAFSPNGWLLASGSDDHTIRLWDVRDGGLVRRLEGHHGWVRALAFSPEGQWLASGSADQTVRLWDPRTYTHVRTLPRRASAICSLAFSPDGASLAAGGEDSNIQISSVDGSPGPTLTGHHDRVRAVAYSPDGRLIASASDDQSIHLWDTATGARRGDLSGHRHDVWRVAYDPDGRLAALSWATGTLKSREVVEGALLSPAGEGAGPVDRVVRAAHGPNGRLVAIAGEDRLIRVREAESGQTRVVFPIPSGRVRALAFSPDERYLAAANDDPAIHLWDLEKQEPRPGLQGHERPVHALAFSPDARRLASGGADALVCLWDVASGELVRSLTGHTARIRALAFSPDGSLLASGGADKTIHLWDTATGAHRFTLTGHTDWVRAVAFAPGGQLLASASDDHTVRLWDLGADQRADTGTRPAADPDGTSERDLGAGPVGGQPSLQNMDPRSEAGADPHSITTSTLLGRHDGRVWSVACSPDGATLASGAEDGTIALWDIPRRTRTATLRADRPYERLNITHATGLTPSQRAALIALGAYEEGE